MRVKCWLQPSAFPRLCLILWILFFSSGAIGEDRGPHPAIQHIVIPDYPALARWAGEQGTIFLPLKVDAHCAWSGGPRHSENWRLHDAVYEMILENLSFSDCGSGTKLTLAFKFSLEGKPTNGSANTHVQQVGAYTFAISTKPPDLFELGLQRIPDAPQKPTASEEIVTKTEKSTDLVATFLPFPNYAPLALQARIKGEVKATLDIDADCHISNFHAEGPAMLTFAVEQAYRELAFPGCKTVPRPLQGTFKFVLDSDSKDWKPTHYEFSGPGSVVITATAIKIDT